MSGEYKLKQDLVEVGRRMYDKGFVASNDGNISVRLSDRAILVTPSGVSKGYMSVSDLLTVDLNGKVIQGTKKATSELKMHLEVYRRRADVMAVVHAHPPVATAFAVAGKICDRVSLPEVIFSLGSISLAEYGTPTTEELPRSVARHIGRSDVLLLANHGALTVGGDLFDAYYKMETLEHFATITMYARLLGGENALDCSEVEHLLRIRESVYGKSPIDIRNLGVSCGNGTQAGSANLPGEAPADGAPGPARGLSTNGVPGPVRELSINGAPGPASMEALKETIERLVKAELEKYR